MIGRNVPENQGSKNQIFANFFEKQPFLNSSNYVAIKLCFP